MEGGMGGKGEEREEREGERKGRKEGGREGEGGRFDPHFSLPSTAAAYKDKP